MPRWIRAVLVTKGGPAQKVMPDQCIFQLLRDKKTMTPVQFTAHKKQALLCKLVINIIWCV